MSSIIAVGGERVNEVIDYKITKTLNEVDVMTFSVVNNERNRNRFQLEVDMYSDLLKDRGIVIRRKISNDVIQLTMAQIAWHLSRRSYVPRSLHRSQGKHALITSYSGQSRIVINDVVKYINGKADRINNRTPPINANGDEEPRMDVPFEFEVEYVGGIENGVISGKFKFNSCLEVLQNMCVAGGYNVKFRKNVIIIGRFNNVVDITDNKRIISKLETDQDLAKYGNHMFMFGNTSNDEPVRVVDNIENSEVKYVYDKVMSNSKITSARDVENVRLEYENIRPPIDIQITIGEYLENRFDVGDLLKVDFRDKDSGLNGYYRIVKMEITKLHVDLHLEFSVDGTFSSRSFDPADTISYLVRKIRDIELFR